MWTEDQKRRFIEGVFLGLGCGYYVTNGSDWDRDGNRTRMSGWLIDGQQRISAIRDFSEGRFEIFNGARFQNLSDKDARRFMRAPFPLIELEFTNGESVLRDLYDRLNFGGTAHLESQRAAPLVARRTAATP